MTNFAYLRRLVAGVFLCAIAVFFVASPTPVHAQGSMSLSTVMGTNGQEGISFEITANRSVRLYRFWSLLYSGTGTVSVYYNPNGLKDASGNPITSGWTLIGTASVNGAGTSTYVEIPVNLDLLMNPNDTYGFIIHSTNSVNYQTGTSPYIFSDSYLTIDTECWGMSSGYPFSSSSFAFYPRQFCGKVTYDEGVVGPNDAGIASIDSPINFFAGQEDITVTLRNFGTNQLTSATINWTLNGVAQTPYSWTGLLDTTTSAARETQVTLGSQNFQNGVPYSIAAWTTMPNGVADTINNNDSSSVVVQAALAGTFTIGGASPDFATISDAASALTQFGLCGPAVFNIRSGTYNERVELDDIPGASATNTVTFQSETGNKADVTVTYASSSTSNNGVVVFGGAKFVTFKDMTIQTASSGSYSMVVDLGTSTDCTIDGCELVGANVNTTSNYAAVVYSYTSNNDRTTIRNCGIRDGSYGLYMRGESSTNTQNDCVIEGNEITGSYYTAYYSYYQGFEQFHDNVINLGPGYSYMYLSFFYYGHDASIERNKWFGYGRTYAYGVYFYYQNYYVNGNTRFVNNMVTLTGHPASTAPCTSTAPTTRSSRSTPSAWTATTRVAT